MGTTAPRRISILDSAFLSLETRDTPMHVGGLFTFRLPDDPAAARELLDDVVTRFRNPSRLARPFNLRLATVPLKSILPATEVADRIDMTYHVRHTALPAPGGERELGELISHLHSTHLDRTRPLWTCHVIEGLEGNRFAIYVKVHHALMDGVRAMHLLTRNLAATGDVTDWAAPWDEATAPATRQPRDKTSGGGALGTVRSLVPLVKDGLVPLARRGREDQDRVWLPFEAPDSILNDRVSNARRVATARIDLARVKAVATAAGASVNDVFLAVCGASLRRHLLDLGRLPERSLIAGVPVSLRDETDDPGGDEGNAVGFFWADLGTATADPMERLDIVRRSMRASKDHLRRLPKPARSLFTMTTMLPPIAVLLSGQAAKLRPPMNLVISNVPGPSGTRYLGPAQLEALYPASLPFQGLGLNITVLSYDGELAIGVTGARDQLPKLQNLAVFVDDALADLETAVGAV